MKFPPPVLLLLFCTTAAYAFGLELVTRETPSFIDGWLNLFTAVILVGAVVAITVRYSKGDTKRSMWNGMVCGGITGMALTLGLWMPFQLSVGDRAPGKWLSGEYDVAAIVLWDGLLGGIVGGFCGLLASILQRRIQKGHTL